MPSTRISTRWTCAKRLGASAPPESRVLASIVNANAFLICIAKNPFRGSRPQDKLFGYAEVETACVLKGSAVPVLPDGHFESEPQHQAAARTYVVGNAERQHVGAAAGLAHAAQSVSGGALPRHRRTNEPLGADGLRLQRPIRKPEADFGVVAHAQAVVVLGALDVLDPAVRH